MCRAGDDRLRDGARPANSPSWSLNPFPFTDVNQITQIRFWFDSTDADYVDGVGPGGGGGALGGLSTLRIDIDGDIPSPDPTPVPEPATVALMGAGLMGLATRRLKSRKG